MGARILIQSGIGSGTSHWIERNVLRIGNDPGMDLTLPSNALAPHTLTLEFRSGAYWVHNRSEVPLHLGGRGISPKESERWFDTDLLELPGKIRLAIEFDEDPAPGPKPSTHGSRIRAETGDQASTNQRSHFPSTATETTKPAQSQSGVKKSSPIVQLVVIALCIAACGFLLIRDRQVKPDASGAELPSFSHLVEQARKLEPEGDKLLPHLQFAESATIRGHRQAARQGYGNVRARLLIRRSANLEGISQAREDLDEKLFRWVEYRLSQL